MKPTAGDVHVNAPLTNISVAYIQSEDAYIADKVFPAVPVEHQSDLYWKYGMADFFRDDVKERAPATESAGGGYTLTTDSYSAKVYALHKDIDDQTRANYDKGLNADADATRYLTQQQLIRRDRAWANAYFKSGVWGLDLTGVGSGPSTNQFLQWNDAASKPSQVIRGQRSRIGVATGLKPNTLVLGIDVFDALCEHPDVIDRIKYTERGIPQKALLAAYFDVDQVLVATASYNTAKENLAASMAAIHNTKSALLVYAAPSPSLMTPSGGYTMTWSGYTGAAQGARIKKFRLEQIASDRIESEQAWDMKLVANDVGVYFGSAVA